MTRLDLGYPVKEMSQQSASDYPKVAGVIALAGGLIIVLGGVIFIGASAFILPHLNYGNLTVPHGLYRAALPGLISGIVGVMGAFGLVCGSVVLVSSTMVLAKVWEPRTWGVLILVFSILSFIGLGGFVVGALLGIIGGVLALRWKPQSV